jgi:hypothetical protein
LASASILPRLAFSAALALGAPALLAVSCAVHESADVGTGATTVNTPYDAAPGNDASDASDARPDGGAASSYEGSPLCNASQATSKCFPDTPSTAKACNLAPDGGVYNPSGGYDTAPLACHVSPPLDGAAAEVNCTPAGMGMTEAPCFGPTDCAPGFECVGNGTCQHYCCSGEARCEDVDAGPDDRFFCDIQPAAVPAQTKVPVCMRMRPCALLTPGSCPATETCAVVREDGETSCVLIGAAMAGEPCDVEHCGADLVCLGTPGQRRCNPLCFTAKPSEKCSAMQACQAWLPLFPDPSVGICQ